MSKTTIKDPWCQLAGGYKCFLESPRLSLPNREIVREVFPQVASKICRFGGQTTRFYSLAQHVCGVERWVGNHGGTTAQCLQALLHDAAECILGGDIPKPVREKIHGYDYLEDRFLGHIMELYELPSKVDDLVWDGDVALLCVEAENLLEGGPLEKWTDRYLKPEVVRDNIVLDAFGAGGDVCGFPVWTMATAAGRLAERLDYLTREHLKQLRQEPNTY